MIRLFNTIKFFILICIFNSCLKDFNIYEYGAKPQTLIIDACITTVPKFDSIYYKYWASADTTWIIGKDTFRGVFLNRYSYQTIPFQTIYEASDSYVRIKWSNPFNQIENYYSFILDAKVILKDDLGNVDTMRVPSDPTYKYFANRNPSNVEYKLQGKIIPQAGHTYYIQVLYNNTVYAATTTIPLNRPTIDSIKSIYNRDINGRGIFKNAPGYGFGNIDFVQASSWKTALYFKDIPNEKNYYIIKDPFIRLRLDEILNPYFKYTDVYYVSSGYSQSDIWLGLDGFNTNVMNDNFLSTNYNNEIFGFFGTWNGRNALQDVESYFYEPGRNAIYSTYFSPNTPYEYFNGLYRPDEEMRREIFFGTIDQNAYNYFYKAKELYKNDGGNFTPSPNTPASNFNNGAQGFFYGVNCFVMSFLGGKAYSNGIHIMDYKEYSHIFNESYLIEKNLLNNRYELPPYRYPFNTYK